MNDDLSRIIIFLIYEHCPIIDTYLEINFMYYAIVRFDHQNLKIGNDNNKSLINFYK